MFPHVPLSIGRKRVFDSVFPPAPPSGFSPAPGANPVLGFAGSSGSFGGVQQSPDHKHREPTPSSEQETVPEHVTWDRAWHTATTFLAIPDKGFAPGDEELEDDDVRERWMRKPPSSAVRDSLYYVGAAASRGRELRMGLKEYDLKQWYMDETRRHFLSNFRDTLVKRLTQTPQEGALQWLTRNLRLVQNIYYTPFLKYILPLTDPTAPDSGFTALRQNVHAVITYSLPSTNFSDILANELATDCSIILGIHNNETDDDEIGGSDPPDMNKMDVDGMDYDMNSPVSYADWKKAPTRDLRISMMTGSEDYRVTETRNRLLHTLEGLQDVGLGGNKAQKVFAGVMNNMITDFVASTYSRQWESPSLAHEHLQVWIRNVFGRLVVQVLHILKPGDGEIKQTEDSLDVTLNDVENWQEIGIARLAALRVSELFDIIVEWDSSSGAIEDLKSFTTNPVPRVYLTSSFGAAVVHRLLHPGASTVEILQLYISIIRALTQLDPRGILLDRVARPIRRYLRERDDTVKVIVSGLLADSKDGDAQSQQGSPDTLTELSVELLKAHQLATREDVGELDWNDMNWVPDPIDAAPDYKRSKPSDVIGSLITLFDSREVFVKELQKVLSDRLLKKNGNYDQEVSVLELLKARFGDSALQACDVMLRDILDSKRVDSVIRADQDLDPRNSKGSGKTRLPDDTPEIHAKILSRLFWPTLQEHNFKIPYAVSSLQDKYSTGFEELKPSRKLTWLNGLGMATVELDLEDRVFKDEVTTWQATVIYTFQSSSDPPQSSSTPVTKTVTQISQELQMPVSLVRSACLFWISKRILTELQPDTFRVLETLPDDGDADSDTQLPGIGGNAATKAHNKPGSTSANAAAAAAQAAETAAKESADAATMAKMDLYWQFIVGMLTNQGAMPLQRIIMMLKIAVPGGFPFSSEELKQFMGRMVTTGKLEMVSGGNYKIVTS